MESFPWPLARSRQKVSRFIRRVRLEAALRRIITLWHQSTARTIRMHRIRLLSYRSPGIWCHTVIILRSAASSRTRLFPEHDGIRALHFAVFKTWDSLAHLLPVAARALKWPRQQVWVFGQGMYPRGSNKVCSTCAEWLVYAITVPREP